MVKNGKKFIEILPDGYYFILRSYGFDKEEPRGIWREYIPMDSTVFGIFDFSPCVKLINTTLKPWESNLSYVVEEKETLGALLISKVLAAWSFLYPPIHPIEFLEDPKNFSTYLVPEFDTFYSPAFKFTLSRIFEAPSAMAFIIGERGCSSPLTIPIDAKFSMYLGLS